MRVDKVSCFLPSAACAMVICCTLSCVREPRFSVARPLGDQNSPAATSQLAQDPEPISQPRYLSHIQILAHDQLEGRGTGSHGIDLAAGYIAGQFAALGLSPGGDQGTYFQNFTIPSDQKISSLTQLVVKDRPGSLTLKADFIPLSLSSEGLFEGELIFAGYGLTVPDKDYDDYAGI